MIERIICGACGETLKEFFIKSSHTIITTSQHDDNTDCIIVLRDRIEKLEKIVFGGTKP